MQPQPPVVQPHRVKLTTFWTHQPSVWFTQVEALFKTYNVTDERMRFNLVLPMLAEDTLICAADIVNAPYVLAEEPPSRDLPARCVDSDFTDFAL